MYLRMFATLVFIGAIGVGACNKNDSSGLETTTCRPKQAFDPDSNLVAEFFYTDWGAPSVVKREHTSTGEYEYIFYYNDQHQLIAFREGIFRGPDTLTNTYRKYVYDGNRIVSDSIFTGGYFDEPPDLQYMLGKYSYDSIGRIVEYSLLSSNSSYKDTARFMYPPENPFENNHSILAGNKILMFVNRDYNLTNPGVIRYNDNGYPTKFSRWVNGWPVWGYSFGSITISYVNYECSY